MSEEPELYEKLIYQNDDKFFQVRLVVNEFRGTQYIHLRKYFLSYEGEYIPSKEGISMPAAISNIYALLDGLLEIVSKEEAIEAISAYFSNKIIDLRGPAI